MVLCIVLSYIVPIIVSLLFPWLELPKGSTIEDLKNLDIWGHYYVGIMIFIPVLNIVTMILQIFMFFGSSEKWNNIRIK